MADPTPITFTLRDGKAVMDSPAPAPTRPATTADMYGAMGYGEGASNMSFEQFKQRSQATLERDSANEKLAAARADAEAGTANAVALSRGEPAPDGTAESNPSQTADGAAAARQLYENSPSPAARDFYAAWPTNFDADMARVQVNAAAFRRAGGEDAWAPVAAMFDAADDLTQLKLLWAWSREDAPSTTMNSRNNPNMTTTPATGDLDEQIADADDQFYKAYHRSDRAAMAKIDARRKALYAAKHPGEIVNGMGRLV